MGGSGERELPGIRLGLPNGQGIDLQMLKVLEDYDLASMGFGSEQYRTVHRGQAGPRTPVSTRTAGAAPVEELISASTRPPAPVWAGRARPGRRNPALEEGDTIYLCTTDSDGMMVSLIQSNYRGIGWA